MIGPGTTLVFQSMSTSAYVAYLSLSLYDYAQVLEVRMKCDWWSISSKARDTIR